MDGWMECIYVGAVFLDLKRASDTVNHNVLLSRLTEFNFSDHTTRWFARGRVPETSQVFFCLIYKVLNREHLSGTTVGKWPMAIITVLHCMVMYLNFHCPFNKLID